MPTIHPHAARPRLIRSQHAGELAVVVGSITPEPLWHLCLMVARRVPVCRRLRRTENRGVPAQQRVELVGGPASQEAAPLQRPQSGVTPQLGLACRRLGQGHLSSLITYIESVNSKPAPTVWDERIPFNPICVDFAASGGWVHNICILHGGEAPAVVTLVHPSGPDTAPHVIHVTKLPCNPYH
ncbi:hypothetical protein PtA15_15A204 [Puccinia triticina]|uniref:Uncharacterized protein n=1 Tax=Puccinia triticina TaxID=208348 RepID=A0ABY7DA64_9BASI|nr:uncharacterized protein PtA15_15A202 [Puccinia triticina]XP_053027367.1 uncharacterized protein PtA15_15A204 [Puccinia triticina]WAQ91810.1 hypothetical protein PtA15_15A202 [Puccinia triticina]WAQ91812.1 hypothetical protein PtA15_15A204 [Puccinia triticina]WAR62606.1 hypothetical protein PtB15_15B192 [Puccinia triticina]